MALGRHEGKPNTRQSHQANLAAFGFERLGTYAEGAPHLMHVEVFDLLKTLVKRAIDACPGPEVKVLDLGAGEGSVARLWLSQNAMVTAVDLSSAMLTELEAKCGAQAARLKCVTMDASEYLTACDERFDIVSCISFLHHVPDYLALIRLSLQALSRHGIFLTFADPIRYDTLRPAERLFEQVAYTMWRLGRPDVWGGIRRRLRRTRGIYSVDSIFDNAEYHVTRNGVDQDSIIQMLHQNGIWVDVITYWSTQSALFQRLGSLLGCKSNFSVFARKFETLHA